MRRFLYALILYSPIAFSQKKLIYKNLKYEPQINTIQLYNINSYRPDTNNTLQPAVNSMFQQPRLQLEFDELKENADDYYVRIIHCNYKWEPSTLNNLDFIDTYNEFKIDDYTFSNGTRIPYVHYRFRVPRVKISGNYLLVVYRYGNESSIILSHRFMIYNNKVQLTKESSNGSLTLRTMDQQLHFTISYQKLNIVNPYESMHLVIRQNQRWDNAKFNVKPSTIRESDKQLEYTLFDEDKYFVAGNEFRFVDFRSINSPGQNTDYIERFKTPFQLWVQTDKSRAHQTYAQYPDINGGYYIENLDYGESSTSADYLNVTFRLKNSLLPATHIYVVGCFNQWLQDQYSEMVYDSALATYQQTLFLKQGWYNYQYTVASKQYPAYYLEGSHFESENTYEILLYQHSLYLNTDLLVGYFTIPINPR